MRIGTARENRRGAGKAIPRLKKVRAAGRDTEDAVRPMLGGGGDDGDVSLHLLVNECGGKRVRDGDGEAGGR